MPFAVGRLREQPGELNINRVNAQQARRLCDRGIIWSRRCCGKRSPVVCRQVFSLSRSVWSLNASAIKAFVPEEFWKLTLILTTPFGEARYRWLCGHASERQAIPSGKSRADAAAVSLLEKRAIAVLEREDKPTSSKPGKLFITSTLANRRPAPGWAFGVKKTMMMAQRLYEAGYITYGAYTPPTWSQMRSTWCAVILAIISARNTCWITRTSTPVKKTLRKRTKRSVLPDVAVMAESLKDMEADAQKLYQLIWRQFVARQMTPAQYDSTTLTVGAGEFA